MMVVGMGGGLEHLHGRRSQHVVHCPGLGYDGMI